jgi:hypothetical protein
LFNKLPMLHAKIKYLLEIRTNSSDMLIKRDREELIKKCRMMP